MGLTPPTNPPSKLVFWKPITESESESESFYSVLLQTQETSAKTYLVAVAEATWKKIYT